MTVIHSKKVLADELAHCLAAWVRIGGMFDVDAADETPDLERLILSTARCSPYHTRLFTLSATWLVAHGEFVAKQRLLNLVESELEDKDRPVLGMLFEWVSDEAGTNRWRRVIEACDVARAGQPLSEVERSNPALAALSVKTSCDLGKKWGRWVSAATLVLKPNALRSAEWIAANNPVLAERAMAGGDIAASILAEWRMKGAVIGSELEVAARMRVSRKAAHEALARLRMAGFVQMSSRKSANRIEVLQRP